MSGITVTLDDTDVQRALRALSERCADMTPAMDEIGQLLVTDADLCFRDSRDPWGHVWTALSEVTLGRRRGSSAQILRDTGHLAGSLNHQPDRDSVTVTAGSGLRYAATHQFGRPDNRMYNTPSGAPAPIPARPFLPIRASGEVDLPAAARDEIFDITRHYLSQGLT